MPGIKATRTQDPSAHHQRTHSTELHAANGDEHSQAVMSRGASSGCNCGSSPCSCG